MWYCASFEGFPVPGIKSDDCKRDGEYYDKDTAKGTDIRYTKAEICESFCLNIEAYRTNDNQKYETAKNMMTHVLTRACDNLKPKSVK